MKTAFTLSTVATSAIEEVAAEAPAVLRFFQLYVFAGREAVRPLVTRAERAGFSAIVLTVDAPFVGKRRDDIRNRFALPPHLKSDIGYVTQRLLLLNVGGPLQLLQLYCNLH